MLSIKLDALKYKFNNLKIVKYYKKYLKKPLNFIGSILSWTIFIVLLTAAIFLIYYFISTQIYARKGAGYEPSFSLYTIISPSMVPNIEVYDVVIVSRVENPADIEVGDIISFNSSDFKVGETISVTHRVVEIMVDGSGNYSYYTKGDNNFVRDPEPVKYESIVGEVSLKIPQLGRVQFFLASATGWMLVVVIPALFIIIKAFVRILKISDIGKNVKPNSIFFPLTKKRYLLTYKGEIYNNSDTIQDYSNHEKIEYKNSINSLEDIYEDLKNITK